MDEQSVLRDLEKCVEHHCPNLRARGPGVVSSMARHILVSYTHARASVGIKAETKGLERLLRSVRVAARELQNLPPALKENLNYLAPLLEHEEVAPLHDRISEKLKEYETAGVISKNTTIDAIASEKTITLTVTNVDSPTSDLGIVKHRFDALASLRTGLEKLMSEQRELQEPQRKLVYEGAVVAQACRKVWSEENDKKPAPTELQHYRVEHPLYKFVKAVFDVLQINKLNPASAFKSRKSMVEAYRAAREEAGEQITENIEDEWVFQVSVFRG